MINHGVEAVLLYAGPNAVTGNTFSNAIVSLDTCALRNTESDVAGADGTTSGNFLTTFVGNWVCGEYSGVTSVADDSTYANSKPNLLNFSGNYISFPGANTNSYPGTSGAPTFAAFVESCTTVNMCGNALASGGYGLFFTDGCTNALVLNNDFGGASFGGIGCGMANDIPAMASGQIVSNNLIAGVTFHVQLPPQLTNSFNWLLYNNNYIDSASNSVLPFLDPASSSVHLTP